jgi:cytochrome c oxidase assembly factor CtaG
LTWWCAAQGTEWTWTWKPYVGVWLMVATLIVARLLAERLRKRPGADAQSARTSVYVMGVVTLWIAADWPIGPLGAGYLLSIHTVQYVLFAFVAPPLLIAGTPTWLLHRMIEPRWTFRVAWMMSRPLVAFLFFNTVLLATHLPSVVDGMTVSQIGSFFVDMSWLLAGLVFWWQILGPLPELKPMPYPGRLVFLVANVFIPTVPAAFLTFAKYPVYSLYELAPPMSDLSAVEDQQIAGLIMKIIGGFIVLGIASVLFFRWAKSDEEVGEVRYSPSQPG